MGSWFEGSHLSLEQALLVTYCWCYNMRQYDARREAEVLSNKTTVEWYAACRDVPELWLHLNPMVIGGVDANGRPKDCEVDESKFFKRKYNRGRVVPGRWVVGGIERDTGRCFMVEVARRDAPTLEAVLRQWIRPGSRIITDGWNGYNGVAAMPGRNYIHDVVIHEHNFVDPHDPTIHTQNVENMWMRVKHFFREKYGVHSDHFWEAVNEWIFRNYFRVQMAQRPGKDFFEEFLVCIGDLF